jgi:hypothetical protein
LQGESKKPRLSAGAFLFLKPFLQLPAVAILFRGDRKIHFGASSAEDEEGCGGGQKSHAEKMLRNFHDASQLLNEKMLMNSWWNSDSAVHAPIREMRNCVNVR